MADPVRIAAIVVTYNRAALLRSLLASLLSQTRPLDAIFVVDNASTDDTAASVERLQQDHPCIRYLRLPHNLGGSGGFHAGVRRAYADGFDWLWLMDDDVVALPAGLQGLLPFTRQADCIHGRRHDFHGKPFFWSVRFSERFAIWWPVPGDCFKNGPAFQTNIGVFEGMLISRRVVARIGLPDPRFFITWDDAIYGWLASKVATVLYVDHFALKRCRVQRQINLHIRHLNEVSDLHRYHIIRNRPLVRRYIQSAGHYSALGFAIGTALIVAKEIFRMIMVQHSLAGLPALWRGWQAARLPIPALDLTVGSTVDALGKRGGAELDRVLRRSSMPLDEESAR